MNNFEKLYESLIPFLKEVNLYDKLQKMISDNKFLMKRVTPFQVAIYLIGKEFGAGKYVVSFIDFESKK